MKKWYKFTVMAAILGICCCESAWAQFKLGAEIRPRGEFYNGTNSALATGDNVPGIAVQQRSRLYFTYVKEELTIQITPQYISFWGAQGQTNTSGSVSVFEAWGAYQFSELFALKFGRQAISYGDQRILGALDWAAPGRAHDALVGNFNFGGIKLDAGLTYNSTGFSNDHTEPYQGPVGNKSLQYLWLDVPGESIKFSAVMTNVVTEPKTGLYYSATTAGVMPTFKISDRFSIDASAYWQTGKLANGMDLNAYLLAFSGTLKAGTTPLTLGVDIASGDKENSTGTIETWQQPFGTNHKFYGLMDYFYVGEVPAMGLNDIFIKTVFKTGSKSKLLVHLHNFSTSKKFTNGDGDEISGQLGTEIDLVYNLNVSDDFNTKIGYSQMFAHENFESYKPGRSDDFNNWIWVQLSLKPTIFNSK